MGNRVKFEDEELQGNETLEQEEETEEDLEHLARETQLKEGSFYENLAPRLAHTFGDSFLGRLASDIMMHMESDKAARQPWENQIKVGMELLGTGFMGPDGNIDIPSLYKPFDQSPSNAFSSVMLETLVSFLSTSEREFLPSGNVLKVYSTITPTEEIVDRNERVETYVNDLLTQKCYDFYSQIPQAMLWSAIAGEAYIKTSWDRIKNLPVFQKVSPIDLILPPSCSDIRTASRILHRYKISERELRLRQESGFYSNIKVMPYRGDSTDYDDDNIEEDIDGISQEATQDERLNPTYDIVEAHIEIRLTNSIDRWSPYNDKGIPLPYIIHISPEAKKILAIYRNWEEGDETAQRLDWFSPLIFFPGFFGRGYGLSHLAGENTLSATRLMRDMLNLNTLNIMPSGVRDQGLRVANNQIRFNPGEFAQIDTGGLPVNQAFQQFQFPQPSPLMGEMKKDLEESVRRVGGAVMATPENVPPQIGQVSLLAMMEKNTENLSAVLQRFHRGISHVYKILFRLLRQYIPAEGLPMQNETDIPISAYDFQEDMSLIPVSDPNLNSKLHRLMRAESVLNLAQQHPELHNFYEIYKMIYRDLPVENIDKILVGPQEAKPLDPLTENMNMMNGKPAKSGLEQDHQAHIAVHSLVLQDPEGTPEVQQAVQAHIQEHKAMQMAVQLQTMAGVQIPMGEEDDNQEIPMEFQNQIAMHLAQAAQQIMEQQKQEQAAQQPPNPAEIMMQEMEQRKLAQEQKNKIDELNIQLKFMEAALKDQKDKYDSSLRFLKETGTPPPSYEELLGEHKLTTGDALSLAGQLSDQTDAQLEQITNPPQQEQQPQEGQAPSGQPGEDEYNPPLLPEEEEQLPPEQNGE